MGDRFRTREGVKIDANGGRIEFGSNCAINRNSICVAHKAIIIGNNVLIGPNVCIYDHDHCFGKDGVMSNKFKDGEIIIGDNVWIGAGAIILRGTRIGNNSVIGAGTVVKGDVPACSLVVGDRKNSIRKLDR